MIEFIYIMIYEIVCSINGDRYIGSTTNFKNRMYQHKNKKTTCSAKPIIERGNYEVKILEEDIDKKDLKIREREWMEKLPNIINARRAFISLEEKEESYKKYCDYIANRSQIRRPVAWEKQFE